MTDEVNKYLLVARIRVLKFPVCSSLIQYIAAPFTRNKWHPFAWALCCVPIKYFHFHKQLTSLRRTLKELLFLEI